MKLYAAFFGALALWGQSIQLKGAHEMGPFTTVAFALLVLIPAFVAGHASRGRRSLPPKAEGEINKEKVAALIQVVVATSKHDREKEAVLTLLKELRIEREPFTHR